MKHLIRRILKEEGKKDTHQYAVRLKTKSAWPEFRKQNEKRMRDLIDAAEWELLTQGLEIPEEEFEEPQVIKDLYALIKAIEEGKNDNQLIRTKEFKRLNLDKDKIAYWRKWLEKPEPKSVLAKVKNKIKDWLGVDEKGSVASKEVVKEQVQDKDTKEGTAIRRLRVVLDMMKPYSSDWDEYLHEIHVQKREPSTLYETKTMLQNLLKIVGGGKESYSNIFDKTYWFAKAFQINGGKNRNFKEGEIQLIEIPKYEMEAQYSEEAIDYRTGWGDIVGTTDKKEAMEYFKDDIGRYIEDSESNDMDYGDIYDVEDVVVQNVFLIKFNPHWVGLR